MIELGNKEYFKAKAKHDEIIIKDLIEQHSVKRIDILEAEVETHKCFRILGFIIGLLLTPFGLYKWYITYRRQLTLTEIKSESP
ncbi:MAG: hypothetical protein ACI8ZQ_000312 [Bacteroidia bacterium]